jgi:hypothetical protein
MTFLNLQYSAFDNCSNLYANCRILGSQGSCNVRFWAAEQVSFSYQPFEQKNSSFVHRFVQVLLCTKCVCTRLYMVQVSNLHVQILYSSVQSGIPRLITRTVRRNSAVTFGPRNANLGELRRHRSCVFHVMLKSFILHTPPPLSPVNDGELPQRLL